jgi:hypothetical protein
MGSECGVIEMNQFIYEVISSEFGRGIIKRTDEDGNEAWIPTDPANSDYQTYLESLEQTNEESE